MVLTDEIISLAFSRQSEKNLVYKHLPLFESFFKTDGFEHEGPIVAIIFVFLVIE